MVGIKTVLVATAAAVGIALASAPAGAKPTPIDPGKVQTLASQIEEAITALGPGASAQDDIAAIQAAIVKSGADPFVARAALHVVQSWTGDTANGAAAVASVDQTITEALEGSDVAHSGGAGGGIPIGSPSSYVSGGGSDYLVK